MSIAGLYTLVATCEPRGINPFAYLADAIPRVEDYPKRAQGPGSRSSSALPTCSQPIRGARCGARGACG